MVGKLFYEAVETIDPGPLEALRQQVQAELK